MTPCIGFRKEQRKWTSAFSSLLLSLFSLTAFSFFVSLSFSLSFSLTLLALPYLYLQNQKKINFKKKIQKGWGGEKGGLRLLR